MSHVLNRNLRARGVPEADIARGMRVGNVVKLRRGALAPAGLDERAQHLSLVRACLEYLHPNAVVSHESAAVLHGLWIPPEADLGRAHFTRDQRSGGSVRRSVRMAHCPLPPEEITMVDGLAVTSLARTVSDISRRHGFEAGVVVADSALQLGLERNELCELVARTKHRAANGAARAVAEFADELSGSAHESIARCRFQLLGLVKPILQPELLDAQGNLVAKPDFLFDEWNLVTEYDGERKYLDEPRPEHLPRLMAEKERDQSIRDLGYWIVHLTNRDLPLDRLQERMLRAKAAGLALPPRPDRAPDWPLRRLA